MKKMIAIILILVCMTAFASAETDLSSMSFDELINLQKTITAEIMSRPEWKEVKVPEGTWSIGEDIPEGTYSISAPAYSTVTILDENGKKIDDHSVFSNLPIGKVILKKGWTIQTEGPIYMAPPISLSF